MRRLMILAAAIVLVGLGGCSRETIALPAPAAPNGEWAPLYAAADAKVKALEPDATLIDVGGMIDLETNNPVQRLMFTYTTADFTSLSVLITQENNTITATEIFTGTINPGLENRRQSEKDTPFPTTPEEMLDYQQRSAQVRISPREALLQGVSEEQIMTINKCGDTLVDVALMFQRTPQVPVWTVTRRCKLPNDPQVTTMIFYDVNAETGQVLSRDEAK